jgi:hypothetical protein
MLQATIIVIDDDDISVDVTLEAPPASPALVAFPVLSLTSPPSAAVDNAVPAAHGARTDLIIILDSDASDSAAITPPILMPSAPVHDARTALHSYFSKFAGCRGCVAEVVPVAPADADLLDLRGSVPEESHPLQFLDVTAMHNLEAEHVKTAGISSGGSDSGSDYDSHSSFIDDSPTDLSAADVAYVDDYVALVLPLTAATLRPMPVSPATVSSRKRRLIVTSSSSSSSSPLPRY